ncbi:MAG: DNA-processing protein DprA [Oscillospiraceae bacterium]|nr:DNA-processing protein DprA [Oscillospiraceae bacterium]
MAALKYWIWLATRNGMRPVDILRISTHFGSPELAYFSDPGEYAQLGMKGEKAEALLDKSLAEAERILENCRQMGVRVLTIQDADYPERLRQIYDPPCVLYVKGDMLQFDETVAVGVVGPRKPSAYGAKLAGELGLELARGGVLLVSGIAQGIDCTALRAALRGGGRAVSVLGCGVDVRYPLQNADLYDDVAQSGALMSEYPPGTAPEGWHFPERNRIISGLCVGVAAVEAALRSGTMITLRLALEQDRDVFVYPGPVNAPNSMGTNSLLQRGEAQCVLSAQDILQEYDLRFPGRLTRAQPLPKAAREARLTPVEGDVAVADAQAVQPEKQVDNSQKRAYITLNECRERFSDDEREILLLLADQALHPDELTERAQIPARRVLSALTVLQVQGMVEERAHRRFAALVAIGE